MNRRTALQTFIAGLAAPLAWVRPVKAAEKEFTITIPIRADLSELHEKFRRANDNAAPPIKGVLGKTFFRAGVKPDITTAGLRCYFDGVGVHERTYDADAVAGWARMYDVDGAGNRILRTHYGKVEFRPV